MQAAAEKRIPYLLEIPASIRFLSCEPLVELVSLHSWLTPGAIQWVICGGYSGREDHPMEVSWAMRLKEECEAVSVAFFMKQMGTVYAKQHHLRHGKGEDVTEFPKALQVQQFPE